MSTKVLTITTSYQDVTTALSLTDATTFLFQNTSAFNDIILVQTTGGLPADSTLGFVLSANQAESFENSTTDIIYMRTNRKEALLAVI